METKEGTSSIPNGRRTMPPIRVEPLRTVSREEQVQCAVREVLDRVGDKWTVLIVLLLGEGPQRFSGLKRSIEGISQRMLTRTLRRLEEDGLVSRRVDSTIPPTVHYELTPFGTSLTESLSPLMNWAMLHQARFLRSVPT